MDRRDFLKTGAMAGAVGTALPLLGLEGCATVGSAAGGPHMGGTAASAIPRQADMGAYVAQLDTAMNTIHTSDFFRQAINAHQPDLSEDDVSHRDALARKSIRSLLIVGALGDLHPEDQAHPEMQARVWGAMAEMDEATKGVAEVMKSMTTAQRNDVRTKLASDPAVSARITDALDGAAGQASVTPKRRTHLRKLMGEISFRLANQDPGIAFDEFTTALDKATAQQHRAAAKQVSVEATATVAPMQVQGSAGLSASAGVGMQPAQPVAVAQPMNGGMVVAQPVNGGMAVAQPMYMAQPQGMYVASRPNPRPGQGLVVAGGILLGVGLAVGLTGFFLSASSSIFAIGWILVTVGAIGLITGLILLIVGAVINARAPQPQMQMQMQPGAQPVYITQ